jgi:hypothetical protein
MEQKTNLDYSLNNMLKHRTQIKKCVFNILKDAGFTISNVKELDGYFIFNFGEKSVYHFDIKEIKNWKFGLWIVDTKDDNGFDIYRITLFGDKEDWIDKFKPSAVPVTDTIEIPISFFNDNDPSDEEVHYEIDCELSWDLIKDLNHLKYTRIFKEYIINSGCDSFVQWYIGQLKLFKIRPLKQNIARKITSVWHFFIKNYINTKYKKYIEDVEIVKTSFYKHDTDINVTFKKELSNDVIDVIIEEINKTFTTKFINPFSDLIGDTCIEYYVVHEEGEVEVDDDGTFEIKSEFSK